MAETKKAKVLFEIKGDSSDLKSTIKDVNSYLDSISKSLKNTNSETEKTLTGFTKFKKAFSSLSDDNKTVVIKVDPSQIQSLMEKMMTVNRYLRQVQQNAKINIQIQGLNDLDKASKGMRSLVESLNKSNLKKADLGGINLSKDPNSTKGLQSPTINIKGLDKLETYNKHLAEMIRNLEKLKELGKTINIDLKGLEILASLIKKLEALEKKMKDLEAESNKLKQSLNQPVATYIDPIHKSIGDLAPKFSLLAVASDLMASTIKAGLREIGQAFQAVASDVLKFEQQVYQARTVLQDGLGDFQQTANTMIDSAKDLGANANEAANGIKTVYAAGIEKATDAVKGYQIAHMTAKATQSELTDLINYGVIANNNYQTSVEDWPTLFNKIAVAATSSKLDVADFAKQGGKIASEFGKAGLSMDESLAFVSAFGNSLRNASEATVAATNMVGKLITPAEHMKKLAKEINENTKGIGKDLIFSASGLKGVDGTLEGYLKNFRVKLEAFAKNNKLDIQDLLGSMFREKNAGKGIQQAFRALVFGEFDRIKGNIANDTTFLQKAFDESTKSILDRFEIFTNNFSSDFKKLFIKAQPTLHVLLDFIEESFDTIGGFIYELAEEFEWLADQDGLEESMRTTSEVFSFIMKNIFGQVTDLVLLLATGVNAILKFLDLLTFSFSSVAVTIMKSGDIWDMALDGNLAGIKAFFDDQTALFDEKAKSFIKTMRDFQDRKENVLFGQAFQGKKDQRTPSSKPKKGVDEAKKTDYVPGSSFASYGNTSMEDYKEAQKFQADYDKIQDNILKNTLSKYEYETKKARKEYDQRLVDLKESLEEKKITQAQYDKYAIAYYEDFNGELLRIEKERLYAQNQAEEKARLQAIANLKKSGNIKINQLQKEINDIESGGSGGGGAGEEIARTRKINDKLLQIETTYNSQANAIKKLDAKASSELEKKASAVREQRLKNENEIAKAQLSERLKGSKKFFEEEAKEIDLNAQLQNKAQNVVLAEQMVNNNNRLKDIKKFLDTEKKLTKDQIEELKEEYKSLQDDNKLKAKQVLDFNFEESQKQADHELSMKKSKLDFEAQYRLKTSKQIRSEQHALLTQEEENITNTMKYYSNNLDKQKEGQAKLLFISIEKLKLEKAGIEEIRNLKDQEFEDEITKINQQKDLNIINEYERIENQKQANQKRIVELEKRLETELGLEEKANLKREKQALEHQNNMLDLQKLSNLADDVSSVASSISNFGTILSGGSSGISQTIGNITKSLGDMGTKATSIVKDFASGNFTGLIATGMDELGRSVKEGIDYFTEMNVLMGKTSATAQEIAEVTQKGVRMIPFIGEALYSVSRAITDATGATISESIKKANAEAKTAVNDYNKSILAMAKQTTDKKIELIELEKQQQIEALNIMEIGGAAYFTKVFQMNLEAIDKIQKVREEAMQKTIDLQWELDKAIIESREDSLENTLELIDLEESRNIEKAKKELTDEKDLNLAINTIQIKANKSRLDATNEHNKKILESNEKLEDSKNKLYEKELDMIDKIYGKKKEKLNEELKDFQGKIKELTDEIKQLEDDFNKGRQETEADMIRKNSVFSANLASRKGELGADFYRPNRTNADTNFDSRELNIRQAFQENGKFDTYQADMAKVALDKYAYIEELLRNTTDPEEQNKLQSELLDIREEYYTYGFDKDREELDRAKNKLILEKQQIEDKKTAKLAEIEAVKIAEGEAIQSLNYAYEQSGDYYLTTMDSRTNSWINYAKTQASDLFTDVNTEVDRMLSDMAKAKTEALKVQEELKAQASKATVKAPTNSGLAPSFGGAPPVSSPSTTKTTSTSTTSTNNGQVVYSDPETVNKVKLVNAILDKIGGRDSTGINFSKYMSYGIRSLQSLAQDYGLPIYHEGIKRVPNEGFALLNRGERVLTERQASLNDRLMENRSSSMSSQNITIAPSLNISGVPLDNASMIKEQFNTFKKEINTQIKEVLQGS